MVAFRTLYFSHSHFVPESVCSSSSFTSFITSVILSIYSLLDNKALSMRHTPGPFLGTGGPNPKEMYS